MTIKEARSKAEAFGYEAVFDEDEFVFLDAKFWRSLGKALGWDQNGDYHEGWFSYTEYALNELRVKMNSPRFYWHHFIDHIAEGKSAEEFFASLG